MLEPEDKERIRAEERARLEAEQQRSERETKLRALEAYRARVQLELRPARARRPYLLWLLPLGALVIAALAYMLLPRGSSPTDDTGGGISTLTLIARCQDAVRARLGDGAARFPDPAEAQSQVSSSSDGKRWDGWVICPAGEGVTRAEFSCSYTPADGSLKLEIIQ